MSVQPYQAGGDLTPGEGQVDLHRWTMEASQTYKIAEILASTNFVPSNLRGQPDDICATILYGREVGLSPMLALQHIMLVDRRPTMSALSMRALAQSRGVKFRVDESTETRCKMSAMAFGDAEWTTVTWTLDRAKKLGVTSKQNWQKQPQSMLVARATSEVCRLVAAPMFLGLPYTVEELSDEATPAPAPAVADDEPAPAPRTIKRAPLKATASVPRAAKTDTSKYVPKMGSYSTEDVPKRPLGETVHRDPPNPETVRELTQTYNQYNVTGRETRMAYASDVLGREVNSVNQVTEDEAQRILQQLHADHAPAYAQPEPPKDEPPAVTEEQAIAEWDDVEVVAVPEPGDAQS